MKLLNDHVKSVKIEVQYVPTKQHKFYESSFSSLWRQIFIEIQPHMPEQIHFHLNETAK